jgi:hypothetical protein
MRFTKASSLSSLIVTAGLLACGAAGAQQASFAVAITLHATMSKPLAVAQLCAQQPKPIDMLGARIQVDCPMAGPGKGTAGATVAAAARPAPPEVLVTF